MHRKLLKSIVCLLIVMQCVCSPLAQAAENGVYEQPLFYTAAGSAQAELIESGFANAAENNDIYDTGDDTHATGVAASPSERLFANTRAVTGSHYESIIGGYGYPISERVNVETSASYVEDSFGPLKAKEEFDYVTEQAIVEAGVFDLNAQGDYQDQQVVIAVGDDVRVPDYEYDQLYVYGGNGKIVADGKYGSDSAGNMRLTRVDENGNEIEVVSLRTAFGAETPITELSGEVIINGEMAKDLLSSVVYDPYDNATYYDKKIFPIVGGWLPSSRADITELPVAMGGGENQTLYKYDASNTTASMSELIQVEASEYDTTSKFFLRVDESVETISLDLSVFEPYLDFQMSLVDGNIKSDDENILVEFVPINPELSELGTYKFKEKLNVTDREGAPVSVVVNGESTADGMSVLYTALNDGYYSETKDTNQATITAEWISENSLTAPASSEWIIDNIPLTRATDPSLAETDGCNVIEVTVTAPNGTNTETYIFYVQRLSEPEFSEKPGNTPAGMIARETSGWGSTDEQIETNKEAWLDYFKSHRSLRNSIENTSYYVKGDINNGGNIFDGKLGASAWKYDPNVDIDLDPTALVVYQNYNFSDPGFTVTMSNSKEFDDGSIGKLERRILLDMPADNSTMLDALFGENVKQVYYTGGEASGTFTEHGNADGGWETLENAAAITETIYLADAKILPGVYKIEYRFTDDYTGETYAFHRPLVVLALPGDVDMDGVTTVADGYALATLLSDTNNLFVETNMSPREALFALRVCNVAGTAAEIVNTEDADLLKSGWRPQLVTRRSPASTSTTSVIGVSDYRYIPLADMSTRYTRQPEQASATPTVSLSATKASTVIVENTGNASVLMSRATNELAAPLALFNTLTEDSGVAAGDVFFVDVTLSDLDTVNVPSGVVESFTYALAYDSRYVRPATMSDMNGTTAEADGGKGNKYAAFDESTYVDELEAWRAVITHYNTANSSDDYAGETIWSGKGYYVTDATQPARTYSGHFSQVYTDFEKELEGKYSDIISSSDLALKEMTFSIGYNNGGGVDLSNLSEDSIILRVPFFMHTYPIGAEDTMELVSLNLGMQETTIVTSNSGELSASAYSAQSTIFAGETANLSSVFTYGETALALELAEDNTDRTLLVNTAHGSNGKTIYGEEFSNSVQIASATLTGKLPKGVKYDSSGTISGIPEESGTFNFELTQAGGNILFYSIVVDKRDLRIYPIGGESYYGESDYTTAGYAEEILTKAKINANGEYEDNANYDYRLAYGYYVEDIDELDLAAKAADVANDGSMKSLPKIISVRSDGLDLDFTHPTLTSTRTATSAVGEYLTAIDITAAEAANYNFVIVDNPSAEAAKVKVLKRPISVNVTSEDNFKSILSNNGELSDETNAAETTKLDRYSIVDREKFDGLTGVAVLTGATYEGEAKSQFIASSVYHSDSITTADGRRIYNNLPISTDLGILSDDMLQISYTAAYIQTETDKQVAPLKNFDIPESGFGWRSVLLSGVQLDAAGSHSNYSLILETDKTFTITNGGLVKNVVATGVTANWSGIETEIDYGDTLNVLSYLNAYVDFGDEYADARKHVTYSYDTEKRVYTFWEHDMYVSLITKERMVWEVENLKKHGGEVGIGFGNSSKDTAQTPAGPVYYMNDGVIQEVFDQNKILDATGDDVYYLRVAYAQRVKDTSLGEGDEGELVIYKTAYSDPITVNQREVSLRADSIHRYYGESVDPSYVFEIRDLAPHDQRGITGVDGWADGKQLETLLSQDSSFTAPTLKEVDNGATVPNNKEVFTNGTELNEFSHVTDVDFYIGIYNASAKNYKFTYTQHYGTTSIESTDFGFNTGRIYRRPIILKSLGTDILATYYRDITNLSIEGLARDSSRGVTFESVGTAVGTPYYNMSWYQDYRDGKNPPIPKLAYPMNNPSVLVGSDVLGIKFNVDLLPENQEWHTFADSYFDPTTTSTYAVLTSFSLDTSYPAANNYELVYKTDSHAMNTTASGATAYVRTENGNGTEYVYTPGATGGTPVYVVGTVDLVERPIVSLDIVSAPAITAYTYGDTFDPTGLTVNVNYEALEERGGGFDSRVVTFDKAKVIDGDTIQIAYSYDPTSSTNTFGNYGLSIKLGGQAVEYNDYLTPKDHHNKKITVHYGSTINSAESSFVITVAKKTLTLRVVDQHRFYGENNYSVRFRAGTTNAPGDARYEYFFLLSDLVEQDKAAVSGTDYVSGTFGYGYLDTGNVNHSALSVLDGYSAVSFTTEANASSDVNVAGYALTLSGGTLDNYTLAYENSTISVYPRPIVVDDIYAGYTGDDDTDRSIYSIFTGAVDGTFYRSLPYKDSAFSTVGITPAPIFLDSNNTTMESDKLQPNYNGGALNGWQWFSISSAATFDTENTGSTAGYTAPSGYSLPSYARFYLTREGIIGDDNPNFDLTITIGSIGGSTENRAIPATATVTDMRAGSGNNDYLNYSLEREKREENLPARAEKRIIDSIKVFSVPNAKLNSYTYKDTLNLSGLIVELNYATSAGETGFNATTQVPYNSASDFAMYGLYISYYPESTLKAADSDRITSIKDNYRPASAGDYLTIAPVHDDIGIRDEKPETWDYGTFAHNGKYLLISAINYDDDGMVDNRLTSIVAPIFLCEEADDGITVSAVQRIAVKPFVLDYSLTASDKDYDGTTRAVGSITLSGVHTATNDLVYVATGRTDYEGGWLWHEGNTTASAQRTALQAMANGGYTFSSGSVSTKAGDINDSMTYTDADKWNNGTLTFEFVDEDVYYGSDDDNAKDDTSARWDEWGSEARMTVEATNIILGGPDAANYTFAAVAANETPVHTIAEAPSAKNPTARITRAERTALDPTMKLPELQIDDKTGVVRLLYNSVADEVVAAAKDASAAERKGRTGVDAVDNYDDELHIEYAIEYFLPGDDGSIDLADSVEYRSTNSYLDGSVYWQDTYYFGGEAVDDLYDLPTGKKFHASADGFVVEEEEPEEMGYDSELVGQLYKWTNYDARINPSATVAYTFEGETSTAKLIQYLELNEDDELLPRETEWLFDDGFVFHVADTSTEARIIEINGDSYYYFYGYYTTDRDPIPRGAYVIGKVRIAATHNYNASEPLYTNGESALTETALDGFVATADGDVAARNNYISAVAENDREDVGPAPVPSAEVVRMYDFRLDLRYAEDMDSANDADDATYDFRVLRAVQFTDYTPYVEQEQMDAVVYNDLHDHYSGYFWDDRYQNSLEFDEDAPIDLGVEIGPLEVDREYPDGTSYTSLENFNNSNTIPIYVEIDPGSGLIPERWIDIKLELLEFYDDDEPFDLSTLEVEFYPKRYTRLELKWVSSDESVVRINEEGMLEIVGVGTAVLTATSYFEKTDTITVIVRERPEPPVEPPKQTGVFNHELLAEFLGLDEDYFFYPEREMTRGELVLMASMFFIANDSWTRQEAIEFIDIVGDEPYAEAVTLLSEWGIIVGVGGDRFAGERIASRAEAAAILGRMLGVEPADYIGAPTFSDSTVNETWAAGYIAALRALGATNGIGNNLFAPNRGITRAEAAAMYGRLLNHQIPSKQYVIPVDVPEDHWAFGHIVRAVNNVILPVTLEKETETETKE